jgi:uncharacterized protein
MKTTKLNWIAGLPIAIGIALAGYWVSNVLKNQYTVDRSVHVKGLSEREVIADIAIWPLTISLMGNNLSQLSETIQRQNNQVYEYFRKLGFQESELIRGAVFIEDRKDNYYSERQYIEFRYQAKADITVKTTQLDLLKSALSSYVELSSQGILVSSKSTWSPVEYTFTRLNDIKPEMIEEATQNAREVAMKFAQDSKAKVGKIKRANQGVFSITEPYPSTPEIKNIRVVTSIEYQLDD